MLSSVLFIWPHTQQIKLTVAEVPELAVCASSSGARPREWKNSLTSCHQAGFLRLLTPVLCPTPQSLLTRKSFYAQRFPLKCQQHSIPSYILSRFKSFINLGSQRKMERLEYGRNLQRREERGQWWLVYLKIPEQLNTLHHLFHTTHYVSSTLAPLCWAHCPSHVWEMSLGSHIPIIYRPASRPWDSGNWLHRGWHVCGCPWNAAVAFTEMNILDIQDGSNHFLSPSSSTE